MGHPVHGSTPVVGFDELRRLVSIWNILADGMAGRSVGYHPVSCTSRLVRSILDLEGNIRASDSNSAAISSTNADGAKDDDKL